MKCYNPQTLTVNSPKHVTATFEKPTLTVYNPTTHDTPVPAVGTYPYDRGTSVTCSMTNSPVNGTTYVTFTEGFESGNISGWTTGSPAWSATTSSPHSGTYCARAGIPTSRYSDSYVQRTFTIGPGGGTVTWWWACNTGTTSNYLYFNLDGSDVTSINSTIGWTLGSYSLSAGTHTLKWRLYRGSRTTSPTYAGLDDITVTNTSGPDPNTLFYCTGYTGTGSCPSGSGASVTFTINTHSSITWNWVGSFKLFTSVDPVGYGSVTVDPVQEWYAEGASVQLTATPSAEIYTFSNWSGDLTGSTNPVTIAMSKTKYITANFIPTPRAVVVTSAQGSPSPPVGTTYYPNGTSVIVSCGTTPYAGSAGTQYVNTGWTGGTGDILATGTGTSYTFTISQNCAITWTWKTQYLLTTSVTPIFPASGGTITRLPDDTWYDSGTTVTLTANPASGFAFGNWSGGLSGSGNPKDILMNSPKNVVANFTILTPRVVTVTSERGEPAPPAGAISCPDGYAVPLSCGPAPYPVGATGTRYDCTGWSGGTGDIPPTGTETFYTIAEIHNDSTITWSWHTEYQLTTAVAPTETGSVTPDNGSWHDSGTIISCLATANAGWGFVQWSGDLSGTQNPKDLTMSGPKSITANFFKPTLTVYNPTGHDSPRPAAGTHICDYGSSQNCSVADPEFQLVSPLFTDGFESGTPQWWVPGGSLVGGSNTYHSGPSYYYGAAIGAIADNCYSYMERTFTIAAGGGDITFWWKVSSESNGDYLKFYIDGVEQATISGTVDWESRNFSLAEGTRTIRWVYTKNNYLAVGSDRGWLDDITITNTDSGTFTEGFEYYPCNLAGWTTGGTSPEWFLTSGQKHAGSYSLRSAYIGSGVDSQANTSTYVERKFTIGEGGGTVTFWWKVSSEGPGDPRWYDWLEFYIDGVKMTSISGEVDWTQVTYPLTSGQHTLKWRYKKDFAGSAGSDCGWVDDIEVTNVGYAPTNYFCTGYTGTGDCPSGSGSSVTFTITQDSSITWNWKTMYLLTVGVDPSASGTVGISPTSSNGYYDPDTVVTLTANPGIGPTGYPYVFGNWTGDLTSNSNPATVTMNGPKTIVARFTGQNTVSTLTGVATDLSVIRWSWTSNNNDWQGIAAGVLRTLAATLDSFWATWGDVPPDETCPRTGTGNDRLLFEATDDLPVMEGDQNCPTIDASLANTYTITYTRDSDSAWHCTADTYLTNLYDYYIDQTGVLRRATSTGDGSQANAGSPAAPDDVWFEIQDSFDASVGTVYPNITLWQETGLDENAQYTRHVHAVNGSTYSDATNSVSRYTLIHNATLSDFALSVGTTTKVQTIGSGAYAERYPIDIAYNYARCQILLYASEVGQAGTQGKIVRIRFQRAAGDEDAVNVSEIYMTHTTVGMLQLDYGGNATWTDTTSHTLVYSGDLVIPSGAAGTWYEIALTTPFIYDGTSNLLISFRHQDTTAETTCTTWNANYASNGSNYSPFYGGRCIAFYDNTENPPTVPVNQSSTYFPNIRLVFEMGNVTVTVTEPPNSTSGSTGVWIERAPDDSFGLGTVVVQGFVPIYTKTDIPPAPGEWWYRIRFRNGDGIPSDYSVGKSATIPSY